MDAGTQEANSAGSASGLSAGSVVDDADFTAALLAVAPDAMRLAQSLGCRSDQAADVVQEAACAAWRYRAGCRTNFRSWFLTIVRRKAATRPRDWLTLPMFWRERAGGDDDPAGLASPWPEFSRMPPKQRAALWLRYGLDLPIADVASVLGISEPAGKQLLYRARARIAKELSSSNEEVGND